MSFGKRRCMNCGKEFVGKSGAKFCTPVCRSANANAVTRIVKVSMTSDLGVSKAVADKAIGSMRSQVAMSALTHYLADQFSAYLLSEYGSNLALIFDFTPNTDNVLVDSIVVGLESQFPREHPVCVPMNGLTKEARKRVMRHSLCDTEEPPFYVSKCCSDLSVGVNASATMDFACTIARLNAKRVILISGNRGDLARKCAHFIARSLRVPAQSYTTNEHGGYRVEDWS